MALTGPVCGHQNRPDARFCTVCGADRPEQAGGPSGEPGPPPRWGSPEFFAQTIDGRNFRPAPVEPASPYQPAPAALALYHPPAAPPAPGRVLPGPAGPPPGRPGRLRGLLIGLATFLAAGGITAAVMLIAHPLHRGAAPSPGGTASAPSSPAAPPAQQAAAQGLAGLLAQSVMDRSSIVAAVNDISQCGPNLHQDPQTFQSAVTSRQALLTRLASLSGRSALPAPMLAALTSAWQNSIKADQDFARWAQDEISNGCTTNNTSDPNAQAAGGPDGQATTDKQIFAGQWNPIATRYGLPAYQWNQL
jgi:hypothetical protein